MQGLWKPGKRVLVPLGQVTEQGQATQPETRQSPWQFVRWIGPALMVSIAYMDPGNYGTDIIAGAGYQYTLLWAG
jgi:Mn2+/Fe2+ NRAMP family transporter